MSKPWITTMIAAAVAAGAATPLRADEGMWPMNRLPEEYLRATYGFQPSKEWVEHVRESCVKFGWGGSASFISPRGLVMTNHHVGSGAIKNVSDETHDYIRSGFYAATTDQEIRCPNLKLRQLLSIEDVTAQVNGALTSDMPPADAASRRAKAIAEIEKQAKRSGELAPEVVKLYHGARYHLYVYKVFDDVRLVMAPESAIAFLGGDMDNFEYPRFNLDVSFFRVYENGEPAATDHFLKWSPSGAKEGEVVFMAGNPARTRRMYTTEHLHFLRDVELPLILSIYNQREVAAVQFVTRSEHHHRIGKETLLYTQNGRKAFGGILAGLLDERIMQHKRNAQVELRDFLQRTQVLGGAAPSTQDPWSALSAALSDAQGYYPAYFLMENRRSTKGRLFEMARKLVRASAERAKPDSERLKGYHQAELDALESELFSEAPIYLELEQLLLSDALTRFARVLGGDHPIVRAALAGSPPDARAREIVSTTRLADAAYRRELYEGDASAVKASADPMFHLALALEPLARELIDRYEQQFTSAETASYAQIAELIFAKYGETTYPDATGTLRLSVGTVQGYDHSGQYVAAFTTLGGAFEYADSHRDQPPFRLPDRWRANNSKVDLKTPFNFVSTNDIIGGNSGSPVFNREAEIVGIVFDGNIHALVWDIEFDQARARAVSVDSRGIIEALDKVYGAGELVNEILGGVEHRSSRSTDR